jgi:hypothetical protein
MELNKKLLEEFKNSESKLIAVTKYLNTDDTLSVINQLENEYIEILD